MMIRPNVKYLKIKWLLRGNVGIAWFRCMSIFQNRRRIRQELDVFISTPCPTYEQELADAFCNKFYNDYRFIINQMKENEDSGIKLTCCDLLFKMAGRFPRGTIPVELTNFDEPLPPEVKREIQFGGKNYFWFNGSTVGEFIFYQYDTLMQNYSEIWDDALANGVY